MAQKFLKLLRTHCESILYEIHEHKNEIKNDTYVINKD